MRVIRELLLHGKMFQLNIKVKWKSCAVKIVEKAAELDDKLAEKFLNEEEISLDEIKAALRKGTIERKVVPAFCGTAFKNKGVQLLLDAVLDYLPSPLDIPPVEGIVPGTDVKEAA